MVLRLFLCLRLFYRVIIRHKSRLFRFVVMTGAEMGERFGSKQINKLFVNDSILEHNMFLLILCIVKI